MPALVVARRGTAAIGWRWWAPIGFCFGVARALTWQPRFTLGVALAVAPLMAAGTAISGPISHVVERPTPRGVLAFVALSGIASPAFAGALALRTRTS